MIAQITKAYVRHYTDNDQRTVYVEWRDAKGRSGRTECPLIQAAGNSHMRALLARGRREGVRLQKEWW